MMTESDYFTLFTLPRKLALDTAALEKTFYAQSRKLHPDRFAAKPQSEQDAALSASSQLNDAYRTLKDPIARTEYLLKLEGVELEEQSKAATEIARATGIEKKQIVPPELLEEAFELNMQLEEMRTGKKMGEDDPQLRGDLEKAKINFESMLGLAQVELESHWQQWDAAIDTANKTAALNESQTAAKEKMVALLNRRSYIRNLVRDVNDALE